MRPRQLGPRSIALIVAASLLALACSGSGRATAENAIPEVFRAAMTMSLAELHEKAKAEGGTLSCYCSMAQINAEKIMPVFEARFPGIKIDHVDATADKLVARIVAEGRGGKTLADVFSSNLEYVLQLDRQGLFVPAVPPEAEAFPDNLRGRSWVASDLTFIIAAWNTNLVRADEAPTQLEDFADPKWKGRLIAEPRDVELLMALKAKQGSDAKAIDVLRRIAANNVEFHKGHSDLAELLAAGQAAACVTCYLHHYPPRIKKGLPLAYMTTEGAGLVVANGVLKDAPHPHTAMLWQRWAASEDGQRAYGEGGRMPAHPNVTLPELTRPDKVYPVGPAEIQAAAQHERTWKEIFDLR